MQIAVPISGLNSNTTYTLVPQAGAVMYFPGTSVVEYWDINLFQAVPHHCIPIEIVSYYDGCYSAQEILLSRTCITRGPCPLYQSMYVILTMQALAVI